MAAIWISSVILWSGTHKGLLENSVLLLSKGNIFNFARKISCTPFPKLHKINNYKV